MQEQGVAGANPNVAVRSPASDTSPLCFRDVSAAMDLDFRHDVGSQRRFYFPEIMCGGAALFDADGDGDLDAYLINAGTVSGDPPQPHSEEGNRFFRQDDGRFIDATDQSGLADHGYGMGVAVGDVNNDGMPDVYVTNCGPDHLYLNLGGNEFRDVTESAGIRNDRWSASACFVDVDRDGWLDLFVTNYVDYQPFAPCREGSGRDDYCNPAMFPRTADRLFRNVTQESADGSVRFVDISVSSGIGLQSGAGLGVIAADFNGDQWVDLYVANDGHANCLWINQRDGTFVDEAVLYGVAYDALGRGQAGMGLASADVNADGVCDLLVTHLEGESNALYLSSAGGFAEASRALGIAEASRPWTGFGAVLADFDHDGDIDAAIANGKVRRQRGSESAPTDDVWSTYAEHNQLLAFDGTFAVTSGECDEFTADSAVWRALVRGDLDNDGDIDLLATQIDGPARVFLNETPTRGHWLSVRAIDPALGGRDMYGAVVNVLTASKSYAGCVQPGTSYLTSADPRVHFGLGSSDTFVGIEVIWPDGVVEQFAGGAADQFLTLSRGTGSPP